MALTSASLFDVLPSIYEQEAHILGWRGEVHLYIWCTLFGPPVALMFIFCSPILPRLCSNDPVVFLDVACICQTDDRLKDAGIKALRGFLMRSRELHVMWSPEYFSRLWCVYELAAFMRINGAGAIQFRPIFMEQDRAGLIASGGSFFSMV
eukprot:UN2437